MAYVSLDIFMYSLASPDHTHKNGKLSVFAGVVWARETNSCIGI